MWRGIVFSDSCLAIASSAACAESPDIQRGEFLEDVNSFGWKLNPVPPGQQVYLMFANLRNICDQPIRVVEIEPVGLVGVPQHVRVGLELAPRIEDEVPVPLGPYVSYPPTWRRGARGCVVQELAEVAGYELNPSTSPADRTVLLTSLEAVSDGDFMLSGFRVTYTSGGETFVESIPLRIKARGDTGRALVEPSRNEALCLS